MFGPWNLKKSVKALRLEGLNPLLHLCCQGPSIPTFTFVGQDWEDKCSKQFLQGLNFPLVHWSMTSKMSCGHSGNHHPLGCQTCHFYKKCQMFSHSCALLSKFYSASPWIIAAKQSILKVDETGPRQKSKNQWFMGLGAGERRMLQLAAGVSCFRHFGIYDYMPHATVLEGFTWAADCMMTRTTWFCASGVMCTLSVLTTGQL